MCLIYSDVIEQPISRMANDNPTRKVPSRPKVIGEVTAVPLKNGVAYGKPVFDVKYSSCWFVA